MLHGHAAARYLFGSAVEGDPQVVVRLHATAEVHVQTGFTGDGFQHLPVDDLLGLGAVQIHEVQPRQARILELFGDFERLFVVDFLLRVVALREADAFAFNEVNGGNDVQENDE